MLFPVLVAALALLASPVLGGSRRWEVSAPSADRDTLGMMEIEKRAISFRPTGGETGHYTWPDRTLTYCFADEDTRVRLRGIVEHAMTTTWGALVQLGFRYRELDVERCNRDRINCLKIYYNNAGRLSTTVGMQPVDERWNRNNPNAAVHGPSMHLSTREDVGMLDAVANVAHELGHAWGLYHEHQNPNFWVTTFEDTFPDDPRAPRWPSLNGDVPMFTPANFHPENLADYNRAYAAAARLEARGGQYADLTRTFSTIQSHARLVGFSASDWLPMSRGVPTISDAQFDPYSIMLYPSGAGGIRDAPTPDGRRNVLTYPNGSLLRVNLGPSRRDIERLRQLYSVDIENIQDLHIRGRRRGTFERVRLRTSRHGNARGSRCN